MAKQRDNGADGGQAEAREKNRLLVLERIATESCLKELLRCIAAFVEEERPGCFCAVSLTDESGSRLRHGAAPSLPLPLVEALDGMRIADGNGSCGSAAFLRRRVLVEDIESHPFWAPLSQVTKEGVRACWSDPVFSPCGTLLGTIAIYRPLPGLPTAEEILLMESAAHLASLAIGRVRGEESRRALEEQLRHSQKIEAVGQLAAGMAHDFNNLLTPIIVYSEMLKRGFNDGDPQLRMVHAVGQAAQKASDLANKLLSIGRKQALNVEPLDLNEVISSFRDIMKSTASERITINMRLSPGAVRINADRGQLEQILLNLALNAQDAIAGTGVIELETGHLILEEDFAGQHPCAKPGHYVMLAFCDDGCGMSRETLERMYEPFFTTKKAGRGTGLGLATVYGIVKQHGGCISVKSHPGEGTRFEIFLPAEAGISLRAPQAGAGGDASRQGKGEIILLVEENAMLRETAVGVLTSVGYRVLSAETPSQALRLARQEPAIHLLAAGVSMPEMEGCELHRILLKDHPELPVLYLAGYDNGSGQGAPRKEAIFLAKPFTLEQFMERVGMMVGSSHRAVPRFSTL